MSVADGSYTATFAVSKPGISILGASRAGVVIDVSGGSTYGITVNSDDVTLEHFTLIGSTSNFAVRYGIHASGAAGYGDLLSGHIEDVLVHDFFRTGIDLNGVDNYVVTNVESRDNGGAGISFADGKNVAVSDITTSNNPWGGLAFYNFGRYHTLGTSNVVVSGTCSFGESGDPNGGMYVESGDYNDPGNPAPISYGVSGSPDVLISTPALTHALHGNQFGDDAPYLHERVRFYGSLAQAQAAAAGSPDHFDDGRFIEVLGGTDLYVPWVSGGLGSIQSAVDFASAGDVVHVDPGTFEEQVEIAKAVTVDGAGAGATTIKSPVSLALSFTTSAANYPVVYIHDTDATVEDLTVDGAGRANGNSRMVGVGFWNAGGAVLSCNIENIIETPFSGSQQGNGIYSYNDTGGPYSIEVGNVNVSNCQKNCMTLLGAGVTLNVHECTVTGNGDTGTIAQNGIEAGYGSGGTVSDCAISGFRYTPASVVSAGLLLIENTPFSVNGLTVTATQAPVYVYDGGGDFSGLDIAGGDFQGVLFWNPSAAKPGLRPASESGRFTVRSADPWVEQGAYSTVGVSGLASSATVFTYSVDQSCMSGTGLSNSEGIEAYSEGGAMDVTVTNSQVTGYDYGLVPYGASVTMTANQNAVAGNLSAGYDNTVSGLAQDVTRNWWGAADGPGGDGTGSGDAVYSLSGEVGFDPWLIDGTSSTTCAFTQSANVVTPVAEGTCLTAATPCNTVSFDIARTDSDNLRAFTITFQLSPELVLCNGNPGVDIVQGDYLPDAVSSLGNTNGTIYQVVDNGGGSYTVDSGILGDPCGATDPSGTLFTVNVAGAVSGEVTGTVTVTSVNFRDCGNPFSTIPGSAGAPASLSIDTTAPAPVTGVSATQQLTGNDTDGTTKIHLSWTPSVSGDADSVHVYRAGFGHYPEYDDAGGSVPGAPSYPPSGPWEHVVDLAAGGGSYVDEVASPRDFWYYAAFVTDGCGNVSAVSNMTGGTLNYHLGDFAGSGDNSVDLLDVSILGGAYGTSDGDLDYDNTVDIGPTTDNSTHGRPTTDNAIQFEDLIIFAINYGQVSKPVVGAKGPDANAVMLTVPEQVPSSGTFEVAIDAGSDGSIQGVSVPLTWNAQAVEPVGFRQGDFAASQDGRAMVLSPKPGTVDAAVFGSTFRGTGELATVIFRVIGPGAPGIGLGEVAARDHDNHPVKLDLSGRGTPVVPGMTRLLPAAQNPFVGSAMVRYAMAEPGRVKIDVYGLDGRLVRTLVNGDVAAGEQAVSWDGRDAAGRSVASGAYLIRFRTARTDQTQRVVRLR